MLVWNVLSAEERALWWKLILSQYIERIAINVSQNLSMLINSYCISQSLQQTTDYFITSIKFLSLVSEIDLISLEMLTCSFTHNTFISLTVMSADSSQSSTININFHDYLNENYTESSTSHSEFSQFVKSTVSSSENEQTTMLSTLYISAQSHQVTILQQYDAMSVISTLHIQSLQSTMSQQSCQSVISL